MQAKKIEVHEAKIRLTQLINEIVSTGQGLTITVHGKALVDIVPASSAGSLTHRGALEALLKNGGIGADVTNEEIRAAVEEGRM